MAHPSVKANQGNSTMNSTKAHAITDRELATVIAALRLWQRMGAKTAGMDELDIATNGGEYGKHPARTTGEY